MKEVPRRISEGTKRTSMERMWCGGVSFQTLTLSKCMCMRASGASELRQFWHFYILKLLFLSIFCRYIENKPWLKIFFFFGGGGGQAPPKPPPPHQYASVVVHCPNIQRKGSMSNEIVHLQVSKTWNEWGACDRKDYTFSVVFRNLQKVMMDNLLSSSLLSDPLISVVYL